MDDVDQLDQLVPPGREVDLGEFKVQVKPLVIRQLSPVAKALKRIPQAVMDDVLAGRFDLLDIAAHSDVLTEVCALATDTKAAALGELTPDRLSALLGAIFEVNADFFIVRLGPAMETLAGVASRLMMRIGPIASSGSSSTDTAVETS